MNAAFPDGFLLGCASAAHQVEGNQDNDWTRMEETREGSIHDGSVSGIACDHYNRYAEDLETCARDMHNNAHRFSVEWSRIEPDEGVIDIAALRHYREVARHCRSLGMEPMVTLHHFTLPLWLADRGGVTAEAAPRLFARFAAVVAEALGNDVTLWITINEPSVYAVLAHLLGAFPPNEKSLPQARAAARGLIRMHAAASTAMREVARGLGRDFRISVAHHERRLLPSRPLSAIDRVAASMPDYLFNRWFLRCCAAGRMLPPVGHGERIPGLRGSLDFLGLNYYTEETVRFDRSQPATLFTKQLPMPGLPLDSFGNAIDAMGLNRALRSLWREFHLPIIVTENGVADPADEIRGEYLVDHLGAVADALDRGVDVRGYFYWTQMDNFEWAEGYAQKFGLYEVDRETLERTPRPSSRVFAEICRTRSLPGAPVAPAGAL